jgi:hypothetical protein
MVVLGLLEGDCLLEMGLGEERHWTGLVRVRHATCSGSAWFEVISAK